jgi:hypothetical protein
MDQTTLHIDIQDISGVKRSVRLNNRTFKVCLTAGIFLTLALLAGTLQGIVAFQVNKKLSHQIERLTAERYSPVSLPDLIDLQAQVNALKMQLAVAPEELVAPSKSNSKRIHGDDQQLALPTQKLDSLPIFIIRKGEEEPDQSVETALNRLGMNVDLVDDSTHSGGLFVASPKQRKEQVPRNPDDFFHYYRQPPFGKTGTNDDQLGLRDQNRSIKRQKSLS